MRIMLIVLLLALTASVRADDQPQAAVCTLGAGRYQFSYSGDVDSWSIEGGTLESHEPIVASGEGVKFTIFYDGMAVSIYGYADAPRCADDSTVWHPGAPSILIPAEPGVYKLEIQDAYGHWSLVTDHAHPDGIILSPNGQNVELIGSVGQDTDPGHYRLIEVNP